MDIFHKEVALTYGLHVGMDLRLRSAWNWLIESYLCRQILLWKLGFACGMALKSGLGVWKCFEKWGSHVAWHGSEKWSGGLKVLWKVGSILAFARWGVVWKWMRETWPCACLLESSVSCSCCLKTTVCFIAELQDLIYSLCAWRSMWRKAPR